jgi:hypothetical protein
MADADPQKYPLPQDPKSIEQIVYKRFKQLEPSKQQSAKSTVMSAINSPQRSDLYGELAKKIDLNSPVSVTDQAQAKNISSGVELGAADVGFFSSSLIRMTSPTDPDNILRGRFTHADPAKAWKEMKWILEEAWLERAGFRETNFNVETMKRLAEKLEKEKKTILTLKLHRIDCVETTSGGGDDDITVGVISTNPNGTTQGIWGPTDEMQFASGEQFAFSPVIDIAHFDLRQKVAVPDHGDLDFWPKTATSLICLCEADNGGFYDFLMEIWLKVKDAALKAISTAVGAWVVGLAGSYFGPLGAAIGAAIGAVAGWIVGSLIEWIIGLFQDDEFPPLMAQATIKSYWHLFSSGTTESKMKEKWVKAHGGHYRIYYQWVLHN